MRKTALGLIVLVGLGIVLYLTGFYEGVVSGFEGHPGLPSCESSHGQSDLKRAFDGSPLAKTSGVAVIAVKDVKTVSATTGMVECTATAILNSAQQAAITYSFTNDPTLGRSQYYVRTKLDTESFRPYP